MKILFIHTLADTEIGGGAEQTLWTLIFGLRAAGHQCAVLATSNRGGLRRTERNGVTVWEAGLKNLYWPFTPLQQSPLRRVIWHTVDSFNPLMTNFIQRVVGREAPDIVSVHNLIGWSSSVWKALSGLGVPTVQVLHDYYAICPNTTMRKGNQNCRAQCAKCHLFRWPHRALSRHVDAVIGVSRFVLEKHLALGFFKRVPVQRVIHDARDPDALGQGQISQPAAHGGVRFGYIGSLTPAKGVEALIEAFRAETMPDATLCIAGSGKEEYERRLRAACGSDERIRLKGRMSPGEFFPSIDVLVVPSLWNEVLGLVVLEALAFGVPVIASRRGGIPEMIVDGENGLLFDPNMPDDLKGCLAHMYTDTASRRRIAANAKPSSKPFMDVGAWVGRYETLYCELLETVSYSVPAARVD